MKNKAIGILISTASWLIFVATWLRVVMHTVSSWRTTPSELHYDLVGLLMFFMVIWVQLVRGKRDVYDLLFVSLALAAVSDLVQRAVWVGS